VYLPQDRRDAALPAVQAAENPVSLRTLADQAF
jgi:hypothetical protein